MEKKFCNFKFFLIFSLLFFVFFNIRVTSDYGNFSAIEEDSLNCNYLSPPVVARSIVKTNSYIPEGTYEIISELNSNKVLDISEASTEQGAKLQLYDRNSTDAQKFNVFYDKGGFYTIKAKCSEKTIDVPWASKEQGTALWQYDSNNTDAQKWSIIQNADDSYSIISKCNGLYMDVRGASMDNGTPIQCYEKNDTKAQKFRFKICIDTIAPIIVVGGTKNINDFLQNICNDIYEKSGEKFIPDTKTGAGWHGVAYKLKGENENLCVKIFNLNPHQPLRNEDIKEHEIYYKITGKSYVKNFLKHIKTSETPNLTFPVAAYKSEKFFGNISKFNDLRDLNALIIKKVILDEKIVAAIIYDILNGLNCLHKTKNNEIYCHRDVKPSNIMFNCSGEENIEVNVMDAGTVHSKNNLYSAGVVTRLTGYRDPEDMFAAKLIIDEKTDIFAIGVIMWELIYGKCPFAGYRREYQCPQKSLIKLQDNLKLLQNDKKISSNCKDLLLKLLTPEKKKRISAAEALRHNFFKTKEQISKDFLVKKVI